MQWTALDIASTAAVWFGEAFLTNLPLLESVLQIEELRGKTLGYY